MNSTTYQKRFTIKEMVSALKTKNGFAIGMINAKTCIGVKEVYSKFLYQKI